MRSQYEYSLRKVKKIFLPIKLVSICLLLICIHATSSLAQEKTDDPNYKYLFKNDEEAKLRFSTFYGEIAPSTAWANLSGAFGKVFLTEFGMHLNRKFAIGFYLARSPKKNQIPIPEQGTALYNDWIAAGIELDQLPPENTTTFIYFSHSGINLSYMHKTENTLFWRAGLRFGSGKLEMLQNQRQLFDLFNTSIYEAKAYNVNPEVGLGVNLRSWWRFHADLGYRVVIAQADKPINPTDFFGFTFKAGFAFGAFGR